MTATSVSVLAGQYYWRIAALSLAMLLPSLGTSIANVALPTIATSFGVPFQSVQWVVLAYLLAVTALIVGAGRLGDMIGRRRLLLFGIALFGLASLVCLSVPQLWMLVFARAIQGLGAAIMMALTLASASDLVPKERIGSTMGLLGTVSAVGTALGPSLGGALVSWFDWPAVFAFMSFASLIALVFGYYAIPEDLQERKSTSAFDLPGMISLAFALGAFALSTTLGHGTFGSINAALIGASVLGLVAFITIELYTAAPLIELRLLRNVELSVPLINMAVFSSIVMATLVVGPFYLTGVLHLNVVETGMVMSVGPAIAAIVGLPAGKMVDRYGSNLASGVGIAGAITGSALMIVVPGLFGVSGYLLSLATITAGYALFQAANNTAVMSLAAQNQRGVISALLGLARNLGLISGASAMGAIFALGSRGVPMLGLGSGGDAGLKVTFAIATGLAAIALAIAKMGFRRSNLPR